MISTPSTRQVSNPSTSAARPPLIAIGLDAGDPVLVQRWMEAGHLPTLSRLRQQGSYGKINGLRHYKAETPWNTCLTGVVPQTNGYWGEIKIRPGTYEIEDIQAYDFQEYPPFYALGNRYRVAVFDPPKARIHEQVNGQQMLAWGAHSPSTPRASAPPELFEQVESQFGPHPTFRKDHGDWWQGDYLRWLRRELAEGIRRRSAICKDWLQQERWDLFFTVFGETHSAGHDFHFISDPNHPLYSERARFFPDEDPLLETYKEVDRGIHQILEAAPSDANIVVFSLHGSDVNTTDVPAMFFLAEFLYRFSFPGEPGRLAVGNPERPVPPPSLTPGNSTWCGEVWKQQYDSRPLRRLLRRHIPSEQIDRWFGSAHKTPLSSLELQRQSGDPFFWQPISWYRPLWPEMQAFALPSFSEGYIRINLQGREPQGKVAPQDYDRVCSEITQALEELRNPRNGLPVVKDVTRTRQTPNEQNPYQSDADLIVEWSDPPTDVIESPRVGRIGPVPFRRTGSHRPRGFMIAQGPDIEPGSSLPTGNQVDVPVTLLSLMNAPIASHLEGQSLVQTVSSQA